jgi:hypothetical protein
LSNYYTPPDAQLKDDAKSKGRRAHAYIAAASSFIVLPILAFWLIFAITGGLTSNSVLRTFSISLICSIASGFSVLPFRTLPWYWAIATGAVLAPTFIIIAGIIHDIITN